MSLATGCHLSVGLPAVAVEFPAVHGCWNEQAAWVQRGCWRVVRWPGLTAVSLPYHDYCQCHCQQCVPLSAAHHSLLLTLVRLLLTPVHLLLTLVLTSSLYGLLVATHTHTHTQYTHRTNIISLVKSPSMKKRSERRKHCALAVVRWSQKFSPRHRPPSRGCRTAKI